MKVSRKEAVGSLVISDDVIQKIASVAAKDVKGVYDVKINPVKVKKMLSNQKDASAVSVSKSSDGALIIGIDVILVEGAKIKETSKNIQESIKSAVQNMTSRPVSKVNVNITDVKLAEEESK